MIRWKWPIKTVKDFLKLEKYQYDIDLLKVILMLAVHELGETIIGDLTQFEIDDHEKKRIEREAVHKILMGLVDGSKIEQLFLEFDDHQTKEAMFAFQCDKLECDLQSKLYDEEKCVDATVEIVVQINGKIKARLNVAADISSADALALAKENDTIKNEISGKNIIKELYVPKKLVNIVIK